MPPELLKVSSVCKRWYHPAFVESLWQTVDITGRNLYPDVVGQLLSRRGGCSSFMPSKINYGLTVSWTFQPFASTVPGPVNSVILSHCSKLQNLSLEGLQLSDPIADNLAQNTNVLQLYLSGCSGFSESALKTLLMQLLQIEEIRTSLGALISLKECTGGCLWYVSGDHHPAESQRVQKESAEIRCLYLSWKMSQSIHLDLSDSVMLKMTAF